MPAVLETLRTKLDEAWTAASAAEFEGHDASDIKDGIADLIADCAWLIKETTEAEEPCSDAARARGCTCRMEAVYATMIDPPEPIIDRWCPLHGRADPDAEAEMRREMRENVA